MRRPASKKSNKKDQKKTLEELPKDSTKATTRGKRVKAPKEELGFLEEKGNLEDLWQAAFPVGTEWDNLDSVYNANWKFSNLEEAFEEGGELHGKKVYLFGCTEPQSVLFNGEDDRRIICIPVVVAVVSTFPPSDKIGIKSVQMEREDIIPMKEMKMGWVPYIPFEDRLASVERLKSQIFTMRCTQRRTALKHLKLERFKKYEYCLPYFYQPLKEDELEVDTTVDIIFPMDPPLVCDFDWEMDNVEDIADEKVEDGSLPEDKKDEFKNFVREKVREAKRKQREAKEARRKAIEEMDPETKAAYENIRFYKFYPVQAPGMPDISMWKSPFINRYYGKAHRVF